MSAPAVPDYPFGMRNLTSRPCVLAAAAVLMAVALPALAQTATSKKSEPLAAPIAQTRGSPDSQILIQGCAMLLGFAILAINFLPSKRGHQD